jgi:glucokinase|tara:strand:+ start:2618 stop:3619 length:1002 start_codon:yes stop_codon:yes gene_type:complete
MSQTGKYGRPVLAVDLGGTKIMTALVSTNGRVLVQERRFTLADEGPEAVIDRLLAALDDILKRENIVPNQLGGISIAAAGAVDLKRGLITSSPNLPGWHDVPLREMVHKKCGVNTYLLNDASAAALGEHRFGVGKEVKNLVLLTVGTGIGGGIIINDRLYQGSSGIAGEIGHMTIDVNGADCTCGHTGCLETFVSGPAVADKARRRIELGEKSSLVELVGGKVAEITTEEVGTAARGGDALAQSVIAEAGAYLGVGLKNVVNSFNPDMVIIGGSVARLGDLLLDPARQVVKETAFRLAARAVRIVLARLDDGAGVIGAAVFAMERRGQRSRPC